MQTSYISIEKSSSWMGGVFMFWDVVKNDISEERNSLHVVEVLQENLVLRAAQDAGIRIAFSRGVPFISPHEEAVTIFRNETHFSFYLIKNDGSILEEGIPSKNLSSVRKAALAYAIKREKKIVFSQMPT